MSKNNYIVQKKQYKTKLKAKEAEITADKVYLASYNAIQILGWSIVLFLVVDKYAHVVNKSHEHDLPASHLVWPSTKPFVTAFQAIALLEIVNIVLGLVPAKLTPTCIQVLVRLFIVGVISIFPSAQTSVFYSIMATAWAIADIIRYSTYLLESPIVNGKAPFALVWLRYTLFYILYPIGVAGELGILSASIPDVALFAGRAGVLAVAILMILYIPVFPIMYLHMIKLRSKVLGKEEK